MALKPLVAGVYRIFDRNNNYFLNSYIIMKYEILLYGFPAYSTRGFLGWSTVVLIEAGGKRVLFDSGSYGDRKLLLERLEGKRIDAIFLSHLHYDHCINVELFKEAKVLVSEEELNYALSGKYEDVGDPFVPFPIVKSFIERANPVSDGDEVLEGVKAVSLAGHTPGSYGLLLEEEGVLFAGDAIKNGWEVVNKRPPIPTFGGEGNAMESQRKAMKMAKVIVPGHDGPFRMANGKVEFLERGAPELYVYWKPDVGGPEKMDLFPKK